jgi:hypothetical protein
VGLIPRHESRIARSEFGHWSISHAPGSVAGCPVLMRLSQQAEQLESRVLLCLASSSSKEKMHAAEI